jgi:hypothetical protein
MMAHIADEPAWNTLAQTMGASATFEDFFAAERDHMLRIMSVITEFTLDEQAALIYCPFRALLHLPTWADRRRTFERVAASLRPGGRFAWNAFTFDHQIAARLADSTRRYRSHIRTGTRSATTGLI